MVACLSDLTAFPYNSMSYSYNIKLQDGVIFSILSPSICNLYFKKVPIFPSDHNTLMSVMPKFKIIFVLNAFTFFLFGLFFSFIITGDLSSRQGLDKVR